MNEDEKITAFREQVESIKENIKSTEQTFACPVLFLL